MRFFKRRPPAAATDAAPSAPPSPSVEFVDVDNAGPSQRNGASVYPSLAHAPASSSRLRLPFSRKQALAAAASAPGLVSPCTPRSSSGGGSDADSAQAELRPPATLRLADHQGLLSTRSLPSQPTADFPSPNPAASKSPAAAKPKFFWNKPRQSRPDDPKPFAGSSRSNLSPQEHPASFNLKSFRHVRPPSPSHSVASSNLLPEPRRPLARPRGDSVASDSSQRISVAAFREAQAKRSVTSSPVLGYSASDAVPRISPTIGNNTRASSHFAAANVRPSSKVSSAIDDSDEDEESDDSEDSQDDRPLGRRKTITQQTSTPAIAKRARSELNHSPALPPSKPPLGMSPSMRARASRSASALTPGADANRANTASASNPASSKTRQFSAPIKSIYADSDTDSDDDAPLSALVPPKFGGSTTSLSSSHSIPRKPLVDIDVVTKSNPGSNLGTNPVSKSNGGLTSKVPPLKFVSPNTSPVRKPIDLVESPTSMSSPEESSSSPADRPSLAERLSSVADLNSPTQRPLLKHRRSHSDHGSPSVPTKSRTLPPTFTQPDDAPTSKIKPDVVPPIHIKTRAPPSSFSVVSRPLLNPPSSSSSSDIVSSGRQRSSTISNSPTRHTESPKPLISFPDPPSRPSNKPKSTVTGRPRSSSMTPLQLPPSPRSSIQQPTKPFVNGWKDSPASSTGGSSSGRAPLTPRDGSDISFSPQDGGGSHHKKEWSGGASGLPIGNGRKGHAKRRSVGFEDEARTEYDLKPNRPSNNEAQRKERHKNEAKAAIELGNVINGRGPLVEDDDDEDVPINQITAPRMSMANSMLNFSGGIPSQSIPWTGMPIWQQQQPNQVAPPSFLGTDPNFLAAHQQAMMYAKQAYQMAVAQQAMAAAGDEWERSSTYGAGGSVYGGPSVGMGNWPRNSFSFPSGTQSVYGGMGVTGARSEYGAVARSEYGVGGGGGWGSRSVFGETFGPSATSSGNIRSHNTARPSMDHRVESGYFAGTTYTTPPITPSSSSNNNRINTAARLRAESGPARTTPQGRVKAPPSSWRAAGGGGGGL